MSSGDNVVVEAEGGETQQVVRIEELRATVETLLEVPRTVPARTDHQQSTGNGERRYRV